MLEGEKKSYLSYANVLVLDKTLEKYVKLIFHFFLTVMLEISFKCLKSISL